MADKVIDEFDVINDMIKIFDYWDISKDQQIQIISNGFDFVMGSYNFEVKGNTVEKVKHINCFEFAAVLKVLQEWNIDIGEVDDILKGIPNSKTSTFRYSALDIVLRQKEQQNEQQSEKTKVIK